MSYLMKCGHVANGYSAGKPVCAICANKNGWNIIEKECTNNEGLEGRFAKCNNHCGKSSGVTESKWNLPFFEFKPDSEYDSYYCGCWGWN